MVFNLIFGAVVLAASKIKRKGHDKLPLERILGALDKAGVNQQVVVVDRELDAVVETIRPRIGRVKIALNMDPKASIVSFFQTGLIVISNVEAAFLLAKNQPTFNEGIIKTMIDIMEKSEALIISPNDKQEVGYPLLFHKTLFGEILTLSNTQTIHDFAQSHKDGWVTVGGSK